MVFREDEELSGSGAPHKNNWKGNNIVLYKDGLLFDVIQCGSYVIMWALQHCTVEKLFRYHFFINPYLYKALMCIEQSIHIWNKPEKVLLHVSDRLMSQAMFLCKWYTLLH